MDLIVNQMVELQVMHVADGDRGIKIFAGAAVAQTHLAVAGDRDALPKLSVLQMVAEILHDLRVEGILVFCAEILPLAIDIVIGQFQGILDIQLVRAVENRRGDVKAESLGRKA